MAESYYSYWPEEETLVPAQVATTWPLPDNASSSLQFTGSLHSSWPVPTEGMTGDCTGSASKSHSQAEKRRRDRINAHLATLRKLVPKSDKMDKAALLGSVVDQVKVLKREATEARSKHAFAVPTDVDEVKIDTRDHESDDQDMHWGVSSGLKSKEDTFIRATLCCEDRPELFGELVGALKGLSLKLVRADLAILGGRIKSILVLRAENDIREGACLGALKESLNVVLSRIASSTASSCRFTSKRQRFFSSN